MTYFNVFPPLLGVSVLLGCLGLVLPTGNTCFSLGRFFRRLGIRRRISVSGMCDVTFGCIRFADFAGLRRTEHLLVSVG